MNDVNDQRLPALLRSSLPPIGEAELPRDLWPDMLRRIESDVAQGFAFSVLDWVIAGLIVVFIAVFPRLLPSLLYHL
jgi:hypothetical protein